jgi:tetratricopeptide (TPR) repeat protein
MADTRARIHDLITRLATTDARHGSGAVVDEALNAFRRTLHLANPDANTDANPEHDLRAAVAELGELAGWLLFDAERHREARRINAAALAIADDPSLRWFILSNQALASVHIGRHAEALRIADDPGGRPPRRVRALFDVRAARALAELGAQDAALRRFDRARSAFLDGTAPRDPTWTWWFDERELAGHHGLLHAALGHHDAAIALLNQAVDGSAAREDLRWACYIYRAHLLRVLLAAGALADAESVAVAIAPMVGTIAAARTEKLLRALPPDPGLPSTLGDALRDIASGLPAHQRS